MLHDNVEISPPRQEAEDGIQKRLQLSATVKDPHQGVVVHPLLAAKNLHLENSQTEQLKSNQPEKSVLRYNEPEKSTSLPWPCELSRLAIHVTARDATHD